MTALPTPTTPEMLPADAHAFARLIAEIGPATAARYLPSETLAQVALRLGHDLDTIHAKVRIELERREVRETETAPPVEIPTTEPRPTDVASAELPLVETEPAPQPVEDRERASHHGGRVCPDCGAPCTGQRCQKCRPRDLSAALAARRQLPPGYISLSEAGRRAGVSTDTVRSHAEAGRIGEPLRVSASRVGLREEMVAAWIAGRRPLKPSRAKNDAEPARCVDCGSVTSGASRCRPCNNRILVRRLHGLPEGYVTIGEAAKRAHVRPETLRRNLYAGEIAEPLRLGKTKVGVPVEALEAWIARRQGKKAAVPAAQTPPTEIPKASALPTPPAVPVIPVVPAARPAPSEPPSAGQRRPPLEDVGPVELREAIALMLRTSDVRQAGRFVVYSHPVSGRLVGRPSVPVGVAGLEVELRGETWYALHPNRDPEAVGRLQRDPEEGVAIGSSLGGGAVAAGSGRTSKWRKSQ